MRQVNFDIAAAAFHFFDVAGKRSGAVWWIAIWTGLGYLAVLVLTGIGEWVSLAAMLELAGESGVADGADLAPVFESAIFSATLSSLAFILQIALALSVQGAWLRLMTRGELARIIPLRLGMDELRLLVANILLALLIVLAFLLASALGAAGMFGAIAVSGGAEGLAAIPAAALGAVWVVFLVIVVLVFGVRVSLIPALTVRDRKICFLESFTATRRIWGRLLLAFIFLAITLLVAALVLMAFVMAAMFAAFGPLMARTSAGDFEAMEDDPAALIEWLSAMASDASVLIPAGIGLFLLLAFQVVAEALWHGVGAYAVNKEAEARSPEPAQTAPET